MKALLLNGSPRGKNSNTLLLAEAFLRGLGCEYQTITLAEKEFAPCNGCMTCWAKGDGTCVFRDDMQEILTAIFEADVLVESFPLFYFGMPAKMKAFTDRTFCLMQPYHGQSLGENCCTFQTPRDERLRQKKLVLISSCGYTDANLMFDAMLRQYDMLCYGRNYTPILCPQGELLQVEQLAPQLRRRFAAVEEAGRQYAADLALPESVLEDLRKPLVDPRVFQMIAQRHWAARNREGQEK